MSLKSSQQTSYLSEREVNIIRGKSMAGDCTRDEILSLCYYIDELESILNEADEDDTFGTEGWRHRYE